MSIPSYGNSAGFVQYEVRVVTADGASWSVQRRFRRFRDLHMLMSQTYGPRVQALAFPSRRLFGSASAAVSAERQAQLGGYLSALVRVCAGIPESPIYRDGSKQALINFSYFFEPEANDAQ